ncbi:MAG: serine/threonine protein kinase [Alphaproteobacteria bacterium]|nr:serine/threonine protein kinase [Alphaproteobacteria bacterium]
MTTESFDSRVGKKPTHVSLLSQSEAVRLLIAGVLLLVFLVFGSIYSGQQALVVARGRLTQSLTVLLETQGAAVEGWLGSRRETAGALAAGMVGARSHSPTISGEVFKQAAIRAGFTGFVAVDGHTGEPFAWGVVPETALAVEPEQLEPVLRLLPNEPRTEPPILVAAVRLPAGGSLHLVGPAPSLHELIAPVAGRAPAEAFLFDVDGRVLTYSDLSNPMDPEIKVDGARIGSEGLALEPHTGLRGGSVLDGIKWMPRSQVGLLVEVREDEAYPMLSERRRGILTLISVLGAMLVILAGYAIFMRVLRKRVASALAQLGQYHLVKRIGAGAMGTVWRAEHAMLQRPTAVKVIRSDEADDEDLRRFEREVRLTSRLTHPNTIAIYDFGRNQEGIFYYAMEYLPGVNIEDLVAAAGPMPEGRVIHYLRQALGSLAEAHDDGLIHRDIKPANLMICERGGVFDVVKVLDFGLVKERTGEVEAGLTQAGVILGTPHYMSPEAVVSPDLVDGRSDLYAIAAVGYYLLTGTTVFADGPPMKVCIRHVSQPPEPPSKRLGRPIDEDLEQLILQALSKEPERRPSSARAFAQALAACNAAGTWTEDDARLWWAEHGPDLLPDDAVSGTLHTRPPGPIGRPLDISGA